MANRVQRPTRENARRRAADILAVGMDAPSKVWLSTKDLSIILERARRFVPKFCRPFHILVFPATDTYELNLSERYTRRRLHNKFHVSLSKLWIESDDCLFPNRVGN